MRANDSMIKEEWKELEETDAELGRGKALLDKTEYELEHPEWYDGPCLCQL